MPSGPAARVEANLAALRVLRTVRAQARPADPSELHVLAGWSGWGAVPDVFDEASGRFAAVRAELAELLSPAELAAAARNTLNAHYTDPSLAAQVWSALRELGFTSGRVLEPGCGSGNFLGLAPAGAQLVGVELEPVTAGIAATLYPHAQVLAESFADTRVPEGSFDLVVGNVPFGKAALSDPVHNRGGHSIHNHFVIKGLHLTAPGGLVAVITSRYTLDAANPAARREIAGLADLVGAIRLPASAHQRTAGTRVVTDLLVLRRRETDADPAPVDWERTELAQLGAGDPVRINSYFLHHPEMVCGRLEVARGQFSATELTVTSDQPPARLLADALARLVEHGRADELTHQPVATDRARRAALVGRSPNLHDGHLAPAGDGFTQLTATGPQPYLVAASQRAELRSLLGLRDCVVELLAAEAASAQDTDEVVRLRELLNHRYELYAGTYGPINRFSWRRTGRTHPDTGEDLLARINPRQGGFRTDPHAPLVYALEQFDSATQRASKASILTQRVVAPRVTPLGADTPADALAICMDNRGRVELGEVARLLGVTESDARTQLGTLVFADPAQGGRLVPAAEYLSGNVRDKLDTARAAAEDDPALQANIDALAEVLPADIAPEDIVARLGASWIDQRHVQAFLRETFADQWLTVEHAYGAQWTVKGIESGVAATDTWGTPDLPAPRIAQLLLCQRPVLVHDEIEYTLPGGDTATRRVLNTAKTVTAQAKAQELGERFSDWVWEEPARAVELAATYNRTFNSLVLRSYDDVELSLPGLALTFRPNPHQVAAAARMIAEPAVGLWHEVGAGKTAEMAMGVMELRRLGLVRKPAIVIPNHMIEQFSREFNQLYPRARVLAASSADLTRDRRRTFVARVATGDWDAVIMTRGAFERIPMSPEAQRDYLNEQLDVLRAAIERQKASGERSYSLKRMETSLLNAEERIKDKLVREHDPAVTFERSGIDYLVVDEAHDYKNLRTASNIPGAAIDGSSRASDMEMKLHWLRSQHPGGRVVTFATATPIANSITEAHVMQRYLRPDLLAAAGVLDFDTWAATFGQTTTDVELSPDGGSFRLKSRFARFHNVPELLRMWWVSGDVKTAEDLNLPRPELLARPDGVRAPRTLTIDASAQLTEFIGELAARAERVGSRAVDPSEDNMLLIAGDGRAAALDLRLVGLTPPSGESKLEIAADNIAGIHSRHAGDRFVDPAGNPHPTPGALQLVFCDLSTPRSDRWNAYDELRDLLAARGLPRAAVRFIHEARNDKEKAELFEAARTGKVSVLVGSTSKMGVGTNVQARAVALHHLDCPWRPADLAQRDGRALRRGNQYSEIGIYRYVVEGSFDAYSWQTVARKATFIAQLMRGRLDVREIEDIGDSALSFNEVKALAAGNPLLLDKAKADAELTRLERLERSHTQARGRLRYLISDNEHRITRLGEDIDRIEHAIATRRDTRGEAFAMTVAGRLFTSRADAGAALATRLLAAADQAGPHPRTLRGLVNIGGLTFDATVHRDEREPEYVLALAEVPQARVRGPLTSLRETAPASLPVRLENRLVSLDRTLAECRDQLDRCHGEISRAQQQLGKPFGYAAELEQARTRVTSLNDQITALAQTSEPTPPASHGGDPPDRVGAAVTAARAAAAAVSTTPQHTSSPPASASSPSVAAHQTTAPSAGPGPIYPRRHR